MAMNKLEAGAKISVGVMGSGAPSKSNAFDWIQAKVEVVMKGQYPNVVTTITRVRNADKKRLDIQCHLYGPRCKVGDMECKFRVTAKAEK